MRIILFTKSRLESTLRDMWANRCLEWFGQAGDPLARRTDVGRTTMTGLRVACADGPERASRLLLAVQVMP